MNFKLIKSIIVKNTLNVTSSLDMDTVKTCIIITDYYIDNYYHDNNSFHFR